MHLTPLCYRAIAILTVVPLIVHIAPAHAGIKVVVSTGDASPDGNGAISELRAPALNDNGQLAFTADLTSTSGGNSDNQALYRYDPTGLTLIARKGQTVNGLPISFLFPASIASGGSVATVAALSPNPLATIIGNGGPVVQLTPQGSSSPSGNNTLLGMTTSAVNDAGTASYTATYIGANIEVGLYSRPADGTISTRVIRNTPAPRGGTITGFASRLTMNESGQVANILKINDPAFDSLARIDGTTVHELARGGDLALDGVSVLGEFTSYDSGGIAPIPLINDAGQVAVTAKYGAANRLGTFLADDSGVRLIAPNNLSGSGGWVTRMEVVGIDDDGQVALWAEFFGGADPGSGIYLASAAGQTVVALEDTATPNPGKYFRSFFSGGTTLSDTGELVFLAELSNTVNGTAAGRGLYHYDPIAGLQEIVRTGDAFGDSTITDLYFNGTVLNAISLQSPDRSLSGLNNLGQVAFEFILANGQDNIGIWSKEVDLDGDFNHDGAVDAADYTVWRDGLGTIYSPDHFNLWKTNFGRTRSNDAAAPGTSIPEPASALLLMFGFASLTDVMSRRSSQSAAGAGRLQTAWPARFRGSPGRRFR